MRNPNRLDEFYAKMCETHKKYFPDWRFGQFISNWFGWVGRDPWFAEEDEWLESLDKYVKEIAKK